MLLKQERERETPSVPPLHPWAHCFYMMATPSGGQCPFVYRNKIKVILFAFRLFHECITYFFSLSTYKAIAAENTQMVLYLLTGIKLLMHLLGVQVDGEINEDGLWVNTMMRTGGLVAPLPPFSASVTKKQVNK